MLGIAGNTMGSSPTLYMLLCSHAALYGLLLYTNISINRKSCRLVPLSS